MATVKTAISLPKGLFDRAEAKSREMRTTRSRFFALAAEELLTRLDNEKLLQAINAACDEEPDPEEEAARRAMARLQRQLVESDKFPQERDGKPAR
jgi:hypothetical protein